jgi:hypothetical protein
MWSSLDVLARLVFCKTGVSCARCVLWACGVWQLYWWKLGVWGRRGGVFLLLVLQTDVLLFLWYALCGLFCCVVWNKESVDCEMNFPHSLTKLSNVWNICLSSNTLQYFPHSLAKLSDVYVIWCANWRYTNFQHQKWRSNAENKWRGLMRVCLNFFENIALYTPSLVPAPYLPHFKSGLTNVKLNGCAN